MFHLKRMMRSFYYALKGLAMVLKTEQSFRLQLLAAILIILLMFILKIRNWEKVALILVISWVLVLELINSVLERMVDILKPRLHFEVEAVKDIMAATVLLSSLTAVGVGLIIFIPYI